MRYRGKKQRYAQLCYGSPGTVCVAVVLDEIATDEADLYVDTTRGHVIEEGDRLPGKDGTVSPWLVVLNPGEDAVKVPAWAGGLVGNASVLLLCPRGVGPVAFAVNRRTKGGPLYHDLPVLVARDPKGKVRAVYTSYACHCVTLSDNKISGDWAGYAQQAIQAVADALTAHGFAAHAESRNDRLRIINDHCPFGDVALEHPVICAVDRGMVRGRVEVTHASLQR